MGRGCFGISTGEVGGGKKRFYMAVFALFRWYVFFFSSFPPKQNEVRIRVLSQTRPRHDLRYLLFFRHTSSPTYLPTYYTLFFSLKLGPRVCLGQQFALVEASYVIIRILQTFDAIVPGDVMEMSRLRKGLGLTLWPRDGVPVKFHRAD